jgi:hypothetical protein
MIKSQLTARNDGSDFYPACLWTDRTLLIAIGSANIALLRNFDQSDFNRSSESVEEPESVPVRTEVWD